MGRRSGGEGKVGVSSSSLAAGFAMASNVIALIPLYRFIYAAEQQREKYIAKVDLYCNPNCISKHIQFIHRHLHTVGREFVDFLPNFFVLCCI